MNNAKKSKLMIVRNTTAVPTDVEQAVLVGRVETVQGPCVCIVRGGEVVDVTASYPTIAHVLRNAERVQSLLNADSRVMGQVDEIVANTDPVKRDPCKPHLLAPIDLQAVKACGVTFVTSMVERVVEEMAKGDPSKAGEARAALEAEIGEDLRGIEPGSEDAARVKAVLAGRGLWSQYLEVGLGPDVEIFTKAQPMSSVGHGDQIGLHPSSTWNNPEPEVVLIVSPEGEIVGVTLGNDVNLRDVEGRSALLLGRAKDNNASCAVGPFIRLFDDRFTLDDVRSLDLILTVKGSDGYVLEDTSTMREISRDPQDLAEQLFDCHQYPDGAALFTGTLFAPTQDRDAPGEGFTHKVGDVVSIRCDRLGTLTNRVGLSSELSPWSFGAVDLFRSLAERQIRF